MYHGQPSHPLLWRLVQPLRKENVRTTSRLYSRYPGRYLSCLLVLLQASSEKAILAAKYAELFFYLIVIVTFLWGAGWIVLRCFRNIWECQRIINALNRDMYVIPGIRKPRGDKPATPRPQDGTLGLLRNNRSNFYWRDADRLPALHIHGTTPSNSCSSLGHSSESNNHN